MTLTEAVAALRTLTEYQLYHFVTHADAETGALIMRRPRLAAADSILRHIAVKVRP